MQDSKYFLQSKQAVNVFFKPIKIDRVLILLVFSTILTICIEGQVE